MARMPRHALPPGCVKSKAALARALNIDPSNVTRADRAGRLVVEADGTYDVERNRAVLAATATIAANSPIVAEAMVKANPEDLGRLRLLELAQKVEAQRLDLDERLGELVNVRRANAAIDEVATRLREALMTWPARIAPIMAAELGIEAAPLLYRLQDGIEGLLRDAAEHFASADIRRGQDAELRSRADGDAASPAAEPDGL